MRPAVAVSLLMLVLACARRQAQPDNHVPAVLLAAFVDTWPRIASDRRIVIGPYRLSAADTMPRRWTERELRQVLADSSVKLGNPASRGRTLEGRPLPWSPDAGEVGISFSVPEFRGDTARVVTAVDGVTRSMDRLTLVRQGGRWAVIHRENTLVSLVQKAPQYWTHAQSLLISKDNETDVKNCGVITWGRS
jgi:hypothetical protein